MELILHIIPRKEAKRIGMTRYFTGDPCPHGHVFERDVASASCVTCTNERRARARAGDPEKSRQESRDSHQRNKAARNEQSRRYRLDNPEKWKAINKASKESRKKEIAAYMDEWRRNNKNRIDAAARAYREANCDLMNERTRKWRAENPVEYRASKAERRAAELKATPPWADASKIREVYREAVFLTKATGVPHHVDHEVPLRGKLVCGLHVHFNLRAIPAIDNIRKSNQFEVS